MAEAQPEVVAEKRLRLKTHASHAAKYAKWLERELAKTERKDIPRVQELCDEVNQVWTAYENEVSDLSVLMRRISLK